MRAESFLVALVGLCLTLGATRAEVTLNPATERGRIASERAAVEAQFTERQAACQSRFAVTDCVDAARQERREARAPLRRQASALDDLQRKQRAAERQGSVRAKVSGAESREIQLGAREAAGPLRRAPVVEAEAPAAPSAVRQIKPKAAAKPMTTRLPRGVPSMQDRRAEEGEARARLDARKLAAAAHKEAVQQRNAKRELSGKSAAPLPVPAGASAP